MKTSRSEFIEIRGVRYHVRRWGDPQAPLLFMVHGWRDVSATFQFVVDQFAHEWNIIAPDWCGFGLSGRRTGIYGYSDMVADLDALVDHYSPDAPARMIAHSLGGNITAVYAGIRPHRVACYATLEGFGSTPPYTADNEVKRLKLWLDGDKEGIRPSRYADRAAFAARLIQNNPRLTQERATFLSEHFGAETDDGAITLALDPVHQRFIGQHRISPAIYDACWRRFPGPVLWVAAADSNIMHAYAKAETGAADYAASLAAFANVREVVIADASHNMQHDQPEQVAYAVEQFMLEQRQESAR
jgi:pimeloyl-ACP methyl ester carboxylesterase